MSTPLEPERPILHDLVAFAAEHISQSSGHTPTTPHAFYIRSRDRTGIFDAIAALCVTPAQPQSIAIAVTNEVEMGRLQLLISQGGVEHPDALLMTHIRKCWALLRAISEAKSKEFEEEAKLGMFRYLHQFHRAKVMRIVQESWPKVDLANRQLGRTLRRGNNPFPREPKRSFQCVAVALRKAVHIMGHDLGALTTANWTQLLALMSTAVGEAQSLIEWWEPGDNWGASFNDEGAPGPSPVRRAVMELVTLPRHLLQLFEFARTPSSRNVFTSTLQVSFLPCAPRMLEVGTYTLHVSDADGGLKTAVLTPTTPKPQHIAPHAVCNIISHLRYQHRSPIGFIGLSAPACEPCRLWIERYNWRSGQRYSIRGGDGSWRWPWAVVPGVAERGLVERFLYAIEEYISDNDRMGRIWKEKEKELDREMVAQMEIEMEEWWSENHGACVFGCMLPDGCSCFDVLYGTAER